MSLIQKFYGMTIDDILETASPAEFAQWEQEKKTARETPPVRAVAPLPATRAPAPAAPTKSRAELVAENGNLRRQNGQFVRMGQEHHHCAAKSDADLAAENERLSAMLQSSAKSDGATPTAEKAKPVDAPKPVSGRNAPMRNTGGFEAKAIMAAPLNMTERCRVQNGESEQAVREERLPLVVGHIAAPNSLTARVLASKGKDVTKPVAVWRQ